MSQRYPGCSCLQHPGCRFDCRHCARGRIEANLDQRKIRWKTFLTVFLRAREALSRPDKPYVSIPRPPAARIERETQPLTLSAKRYDRRPDGAGRGDKVIRLSALTSTSDGQAKGGGRVVHRSVPSVSASERRERLTKAIGPPIALVVSLFLWTLIGFGVWIAVPARDYDPTADRPDDEGFSLAAATSERVTTRTTASLKRRRSLAQPCGGH